MTSGLTSWLLTVSVIEPLFAEARSGGLIWTGWAMMIGSIGLVVALCVFCIYRSLREPHPEEHMHAPLEIDTHDLDEE
jgi:ABC-type nickel/cobalt efflux system permease component RcnA